MQTSATKKLCIFAVLSLKTKNYSQEVFLEQYGKSAWFSIQYCIFAVLSLNQSKKVERLWSPKALIVSGTWVFVAKNAIFSQKHPAVLLYCPES